MRRTIALAAVAGLVATTVVVAQPAGVPERIADYWNWTRLNIDRFTDNSTGAHPQPKDVYISLEPTEFIAEGGATVTPFPDGTMIVKERNEPDALLVDRLYLMEKVEGAWVYSFYDRQNDGSFTGQSFGQAPNLCSDCHQGAPTDSVFVQFERR